MVLAASRRRNSYIGLFVIFALVVGSIVVFRFRSTARIQQPARQASITVVAPSVTNATAVPVAANISNADAIPDPVTYKHQDVIPEVGAAVGTYGGEFASATEDNSPVDPATLPKRPFLGTELYWIPDGTTQAERDERQWLAELKLDFIRVQVTPEEVGKGNTPDYPNTDFSTWQASYFEQGGTGWHFNKPKTTVTNIMNNIDVVQFPLMMMMHYGGEDYMGKLPASDEYTEYFLATVYYYNVIRGMNIKYWEVLNEPDWGWSEAYCSPDCYAEIFRKVAERIKNFPDSRVNSIRLGGPTLGSGDPIDGKWPDGYANKLRDGDRQWRSYIPSLLAKGSRPNHHDIGFLSWHDYGNRWGLPDNIYNLNHNYAVVNRVNAFYDALNDYVASGGERPQLAVTELNFDAGVSNNRTSQYYKNFYTALWYTSTLNNYYSTGKVSMISYFYWRGSQDRPKGLVYSGPDTKDKVVRTPAWWAYKEYIDHTASRILAAQNGKMDRWVDAAVTTSESGQLMYVIAVNKHEQPKQIDIKFNVPADILGPVVISKQVMQKTGTPYYGDLLQTPTITEQYKFQPVTFEAGKQIEYSETIPPMTIVYYTISKAQP
jgi:hypothetical protein